MSMSKRIVLDANILIRAILGRRVSALLEEYRDRVDFYTTEHCYREAGTYLPVILAKQGREGAQTVQTALEALAHIVVPVCADAYDSFHNEAMARIAARDPDDWPLVALSLLLDCPIWTEDNDFFGIGIAVWNSHTIERYLSEG